MRSLLTATTQPLADDTVLVTMSTSDVARDGHIVEARGVKLDNFRKNNIVLWQHRPDLPIGNAEDIAVVGDKIKARVRFAPLGISATADTVRGLVKSGVVKGVSIGFDVLDSVPLDPKKPYGGQRIIASEILEASFVSIPADTGAQVTARAHAAALIPPGCGNLSPAGPLLHHRLARIALDHGEALTAARAARITDEARRLGRDPEYHLRWLYAARGLVAGQGGDDYLRRQEELRALTRDGEI
jgi:HK97 family phage prohead protease